MREIVSLWATRKSIDAGFHPPELLLAWDEWSIDENAEQWFGDCQKALKAMGDDLDQYRYITIKVSDSVFDRAFFATVSTDAKAEESNGPSA